VHQLKEQNKQLLYKNNALKALLVKHKKSKINFSDVSLSNLNIFLNEDNDKSEELLPHTTTTAAANNSNSTITSERGNRFFKY